MQKPGFSTTEYGLKVFPPGFFSAAGAGSRGKIKGPLQIYHKSACVVYMYVKKFKNHCENINIII